MPRTLRCLKSRERSDIRLRLAFFVTRDGARRIAANVAKLPDLPRQQRGYRPQKSQ